MHGIDREETILFLHGFMGSGKDWEVIIHYFVDRYNCITIDLPGHGVNFPDDVSDYSFERCAEPERSKVHG